MKKCLLLIFLLSLVCLGGCITQGTVGITDVVLLPEERIFTLRAGEPINLVVDGKEFPGIVFSSDMKVVSSIVLIRQEEKLNDAMFDKIKADKSRNKWVAILGSVLGSFVAIFGLWARSKKK